MLSSKCKSCMNIFSNLGHFCVWVSNRNVNLGWVFILQESESKDDEIDDHNDDENDLEQEADAEKEVVYGKPPEVLPPKDTDR